MRRAGWLVAAALLAGSKLAMASECQLSIEANDMIQFNQRVLSVPTSCTEVELTLRHVGVQPASVLGHNWVLAKSRDVAAVAIAGMNAGLTHDYQPAADARVIASTKVIGGGQTATIKFSTAGLTPNADYSFFCSAPGHTAMMKGKFYFGTPPGGTLSKNVR
jgi:azurin